MKTYSSAIVYLLDRSSQEEKKAYCYPITKIELTNMDASEAGTLEVVNGRWVFTSKSNDSQ